MVGRIIQILVIFMMIMMPVCADEMISIGKFAAQLTEPVNELGDFIKTSSIVLGFYCFFSGFIQFLEYRKNQYTAPLSSVLAFVLPGVLFVLLPFLPIIIGAGLNSPQS